MRPNPLNPFGAASRENFKDFGKNMPMARPGQVLRPNGGTIVGRWGPMPAGAGPRPLGLRGI
jgi:hypothetical protein